MPTLSASASGFKERVPAALTGTGRSMTVEQYNANVGISSWEIDFFGHIRSPSKRALEEYFAKLSNQVWLYAALGEGQE